MQPLVMEPTYWNIVRRRIRDVYRLNRGRLLNWLGVPGLIRPVFFYDPVLEQQIEVKVSPYYTVISVGGRDLFFDRESGRFDGTGSTLCEGHKGSGLFPVERTTPWNGKE